jgi:predicted transcriptional regulator/protocatechuate 3,4-dioxygenase beta subunit
MEGRTKNRRHVAVPMFRRTLSLIAVALVMASPLAMASNGGGPGTETIMGYVYDEHAVPVKDALVRIEGRSVGAPTDNDGHYFLSGKDLDGEGYLVCNVDGYMHARVAYSMEDGESLVRSIYLVDEEEAPGGIEGTVTSFDGRPMVGALVTLANGTRSLKVVTTDAEGRFTFTDIPPAGSPYQVSAEAGGYNISSEDVVVISSIVQSIVIVLVPQTPTELIMGTVQDIYGRPLPGVMISIEDVEGHWSTDLDGTYSIKLQGKLGARSMTVSLRGYTNINQYLLISETGVASIDFTLRTGGQLGRETLWVQVLSGKEDEPVRDASVGMDGSNLHWNTDSNGVCVISLSDMEGEREVTVSKDNFTTTTEEIFLEEGGSGSLRLRITRVSNAVLLEGSVTDGSTGAPLPNARVTVNASGILFSTITDSEGGFTVHNLPPGVDTVITTWASGYVTSETSTSLLEYFLNTVAIKLYKERDDSVHLEGRVQDRTDLDPVTGAQVTLWKGELLIITRTDEDGPLYYLIDHQNYIALGGEIELPAEGGFLGKSWVMEPVSIAKTVVRGSVRDQDGLPVEGATVSLTYGQRTWETQTWMGVYELYLSLEGDFTADISATADDYGWHNMTRVILAHMVNWIDLAVPLGPEKSNILGYVLTEGQRPLPSAEVFLTRGGAFNERAITGPDGSFAFRLVPSMDGPYQLSTVIPGYSGASTDAFAMPGSSTYYTLTVKEDVLSIETMVGHVTSVDGQPMASAVVEIEGFSPLLTDANGTFIQVAAEMEGIRRVFASSPGFETAWVDVNVPPGMVAVLNITLVVKDDQTTTVTGFVVEADDGKPLQGATVRLGWVGSSSWTFETTTDSKGNFEFHGIPLAWHAITMIVSHEGFYPDSADFALSPTEGTWVVFSMQRIEVDVPEEPTMTQEQRRAVGVSVGVTIATLAAIAATEVGRVALLGLLLVPLYTKIKRERVMDHFVRGRMYEYICQNPGVNYSSIKEQFKLTNGTVTYHLSMLERQEFIRSKLDGIYKRYFANGKGQSYSDVEPMSVQLSIAKAIREKPGMTQKEIARHLGSSKQLISYHIRKMRDEGTLETRRKGRAVKVFPNHLTPE